MYYWNSFAPVAQLDRVSASEVEGRAFESHQVYKKECFFKALFLFEKMGLMLIKEFYKLVHGE